MNRETKYGCRQCPDYLPPEGKIVDGKLQCPGIGNVPMREGNGLCMVTKKHMSRLKACPRGGEQCR